MGGAGTGVPPVELLVEPPLELEDELLLVDEDVDELVLPPKLDEPLELPPDELEPDELELEEPPLLPFDPP